jgi:hypothetical protein
VVGPASRSRRHERPSRRPSADGAGHQGRRGGRPGYKPGWGLDPHRLLPVEPTNLASSLSLCQFGLARLVSAGRRADAARLGRLREGPLGPTLAGPSAAAAPRWERDTGRSADASGARTVGGTATYPLRRFCTALSGGRLTGPQACEAAPHAWWRRARLRGHGAQSVQVELVGFPQLTSGSASVWSGPDRGSRLDWMIIGMIKGHPTASDG